MNKDEEEFPYEDPWCCNGNMEECALCRDHNPAYPGICPGHPRTLWNRIVISLHGD